VELARKYTMDAFICVLLIFSCCLVASGKQVVVLNEPNFDSVALDENNAVLVDFYSSAPWCENCTKLAPLLENIAESFQKVENCIIAKVDLEVDRDFKSRYPVSEFKSVFMFFPKGVKKGYKYAGGKSEQQLVDFLNEKCDSKIVSQTGRSETFDKITEQFMKSGTREEAFEKVASVDDPAEKKSGEYYMKVMKKVMENSGSFVDSEINRLNKLLSGKMKAEKREDAFKRRNILHMFKNSDGKDEL